MEKLIMAYLLYYHSELALPAKDRFYPRQPLYIREDFSRTNEDLTWVETICFIKEQALGREANHTFVKKKIQCGIKYITGFF